MSLLLPVYFAHHGLDIHGSRGGSGLGLLHLFLLPDDDGVDAWASVPSILLQLGRTNVETETDGCKTCSLQKNSIVTSGLEAGPGLHRMSYVPLSSFKPPHLSMCGDWKERDQNGLATNLKS